MIILNKGRAEKSNICVDEEFSFIEALKIKIASYLRGKLSR